MRFLTLWILIICLLAFFGVGKAFYQEDNTINIHSITRNDSRLQWNSSIFTYRNTSQQMSNSDVAINRMVNIIYKYADAIGYSFFELAKWGTEIGFRNPEWNYLWLIKWLAILILIMIFIPLLMVLPYLIAITYILICGVKKLIQKIKEVKKFKGQ